jgi:hypothetical protein
MIVKNINPYLTDRPTNFIESRAKPISAVPEIKFGSQPIDGGYLIFDEMEYKSIILEYSKSQSLFRRYVGSKELINGDERWVLWLKDVDPSVFKCFPKIVERIEKVRDYRLGKIPQKGKEFKESEELKEAKSKFAKTPFLFASERHPDSGNYLCIPSASSEKRQVLYLYLFWDESANLQINYE